MLDGYLIAFGSFLLVAGRLGDLLGRKRVLLGGLGVFVAASALCGLAPNVELLVGARVLQGLGGAFASAVVLAIIATEYPSPQERSRAMSLYVFISVGGGSLGLLAGGLLTEAISWHWIFFVNVPIGLAALAAGRALVADTPGLGLRDGVDWLGAILVTATGMLGVFTIIKAPERGWVSAATLGTALATPRWRRCSSRTSAGARTRSCPRACCGCAACRAPRSSAACSPAACSPRSTSGRSTSSASSATARWPPAPRSCPRR